MSNTRVCHAKLRRKALLKRAEVFWALPREGAIFGHEGESPENIVKICVLPSGKYVTSHLPFWAGDLIQSLGLARQLLCPPSSIPSLENSYFIK